MGQALKLADSPPAWLVIPDVPKLVQRLAPFAWWLQEARGNDSPFPMGCMLVASWLGTDSKTAWRVIQAGEAARVITRVRTWDKKDPDRYRYADMYNFTWRPDR